MFFESVCILFLFAYTYQYTVEVKTKQGKVIGKRAVTISGGKYYYAFYGIPYAELPTGDLRFKDPQPKKKWDKAFDATTEYHGACAQQHIVHKHAVYGHEDCLNLNIYTPYIPKHGTSSLKPVVVWIHGYAFTSSLSHMFGGDALIDHDIVFITVTHRIGVFGFLKIDEDSFDVNMGLKDIVISLKWVRKNIKRFGGDNKKITVMASDSAATLASLLLMTDNRKLFSKMILQSGSIFSPSIFQSNHKLERERFLRNLRHQGFPDFMTAPTKEIIAASHKMYSTKEMINMQRPVVPFSPIIDSISNTSILRTTPDEYYRNINKEFKSKRILIGFNSVESITEVIPFLHNTQYLKYFQPYFKFMVPFSGGCSYNYTSKSYKEIAHKIKKHYFQRDITEKSVKDFLRYTTDLKKFPIWKFIKAYISATRTKIFVYKFNYVGGYNAAKATSTAGANIKVKGASNGDEICYILKCEPLWENYIRTSKDPKDRDGIFMKQISEMWASFIKTGDPTPSSKSGQIAWPPMTLKESNIMLLANVTRLIHSDAEEKAFLFWNDVYETYYANNNRCAKNVHDEF